MYDEFVRLMEKSNKLYTKDLTDIKSEPVEERLRIIREFSEKLSDLFKALTITSENLIILALKESKLLEAHAVAELSKDNLALLLARKSAVEGLIPMYENSEIMSRISMNERALKN